MLHLVALCLSCAGNSRQNIVLVPFIRYNICYPHYMKIVTAFVMKLSEETGDGSRACIRCARWQHHRQ